MNANLLDLAKCIWPKYEYYINECIKVFVKNEFMIIIHMNDEQWVVKIYLYYAMHRTICITNIINNNKIDTG